MNGEAAGEGWIGYKDREAETKAMEREGKAQSRMKNGMPVRYDDGGGIGVDWKKIKTEYITTEISYRALAEKYSVSMSTLSKYAAKHNWPTQRQKHRDKVVTDAAARIGNREVNQLYKVAKASDRLSSYIAKVTRQTENLEREGGKPDTKAIRDLTASLRDLTAVIRDVYDLPTLQERRAYDLAERRLELERARMGTMEEENETGVVVLPAVLEPEPRPEDEETINKAEGPDQGGPKDGEVGSIG